MVMTVPRPEAHTAPVSSETSLTVRYPSGGDTVAAHLSLPVSPNGAAVLVLHDKWGLDAFTTEKCAALSQAGFIALAPDLFRGRTAADYMEAHELERGVPEDRLMQDIQSAVAFLKTKAVKKIGITGWSMGGTYALRVAVETSLFSACATNYGALIVNDSALQRLSAPLMGNYGATDFGIDAETVRAFDRTLTALGKPHDIKLYPDAGHDFAYPPSPNYSAAAAGDAWQRTVKFFTASLRP